MQQVIEGMMGVFFAVFLVIIGIELTRSFQQSNEALTFKTETIRMMENGHYEKDVVDACFYEAEQKGFQMEVSFFLEDGSCVVYEQAGVSSEQMQQVMMAKVRVCYPFKIGMLYVDTQLETVGIAY